VTGALRWIPDTVVQDHAHERGERRRAVALRTPPVGEPVMAADRGFREQMNGGTKPDQQFPPKIFRLIKQ